MADSCVFCRIVVGSAPATIVREWDDAIAFLPVPDPCTDGHTLVIPLRHVESARHDPVVAGMVAARAAELAADMGPEDFNLAINSGPIAGQTVFHLHWHIVPRRDGDGLLMPWDARPRAVARLLDSCTAWRVEALAGREEIRRLKAEVGFVAEDSLAERTADAATGQDDES